MNEVNTTQPVSPGLCYQRPDGTLIDLAAAGEQWLVSIAPDGRIRLQSWADGRPDEVYREMDPDEGLLAMVAIMSGFEPARVLRRR